MPAIKKDWWKIAFGENYFELYKNRFSASQTEQQVDFIIDATKLRPGSAILDLGCGIGRHAIPFTERGYRVVGVDYSEILLEKAKKKVQRKKLTAQFVRQDFCCLDIPHFQFDLALCLFTTFGYFSTLREHRKFLRKVREHLKQGGLFIIDLRNKNSVETSIAKSDSSGVELRYNCKTRRLVMIKSMDTHTMISSVRIFTLDEITKLLTQTGFHVQQVFGDFAGSVYDKKTSPRMIVLAKKI